MKKQYEDPEMNLTRFDYEEIMDGSIVDDNVDWGEW